ncbi:hypothetical protein TVAG_407440 [Trichomonas vaginalis G3]|uniref:Uncharacterized protein n=1 Tax=Trichomonas vaginalis (strain ATCC PRA-98 / G3) TaxID=412133 RepID=A2F186_TRIV3|nr:hypothetical protein TVAGG3_0665990 [Trichomonas vaginalis G3]EAY01315.1 hypothetical protein TVAG_407440 [Trichomonas vaginalis G3]KAI5506833.1 hypothetical protein TVAGG3_0665990 [Trichomonas vaginalis G3]|eukprot:XP_001314103.1 hypothetical protein [Trichomonas vaginalis G3]
MSIQRRPAVGMETMWFKPNVNVIGVWRCNSKNDRDAVLDKLCKSFAGLHTHYDNGDFVFQKRDVPVFKIPDEIKNLVDIAKYVDLHCTRKPTTALASIAVAEDAVAIVGSHSVLDGGSLSYFNKLLAENRDIPEIGLNPNTLEPFMEKIKAANYYLPSRPCDESAVRYASKDGPRLTTNPYIITMYENLKKNDFKIYNQKDDKLHGFTESLFASQILSMSAFNGKFGKSGMWKVFGTRPYAEKNYKLTQGQYYSNFNVIPENVTENDTLQTLMKKSDQKRCSMGFIERILG